MQWQVGEFGLVDVSQCATAWLFCYWHLSEGPAYFPEHWHYLQTFKVSLWTWGLCFIMLYRFMCFWKKENSSKPQKVALFCFYWIKSSCTSAPVWSGDYLSIIDVFSSPCWIDCSWITLCTMKHIDSLESNVGILDVC